MNVVIPYTRKTRWNEIIYALRSIERNLLDVGDLIIVGDYCEGITPDHFIPFKDTLPCKEHRILAKVLAACASLKDEFVFTNDDIYFQKPIYADEIGYYKTGLLEDRKATFPYRLCLENTRVQLANRDLPQFCYEIHTPIRLHPEKFKQVIDEYVFEGRETLTLRSLYCNTLRIVGEYMEDTKDVMNPDAMFFSTSDTVPEQFRMFLVENFQAKSRWED